MFGFDILDVAIGLALFFLIASLICSAIREALEGILKLRARNLERGIRELLDDPTGETLARSIYQHGQVYSLFAGEYDAAKLSWRRSHFLRSPFGGVRKWLAGRNLPSYLPAGQFAAALMDIVGRGPASPYPVPTGQISLSQLRERVADLPSPRVQRALLAAIDHAEGDLAKAKANVELWFDGSMDRVSGWYKRSTQLWLFVIGLAAAVLMNLDALTVAHRLTEDKVMRAAFVARAEAYTKDSSAGETPEGNSSAGDTQQTQPPATAQTQPPSTPQTQPPATPQTQPPAADTTARRAGPPAKSIPDLRKDLAQIGAPTGWVSRSVERKFVKDGKEVSERVSRYYPGPQYEALCKVPAESCSKIPSRSWWLPILLGWLVTAIAITFGAPFWFDVLNKFMVVRSTVKPREKSREEGSEDRPAPPTDSDSRSTPSPAPPPPPAGSPPPPPPPPPQDPAEQGFKPEQWAAGRENQNEITL